MPTYTLQTIHNGDWQKRIKVEGLLKSGLPGKIQDFIKSHPRAVEAIFPSQDIIYRIIKE